jgi:hypothetical protein
VPNVITFDLSGEQELIRKLKAIGERAPGLVGAALFVEANAIKEKALPRTPFDTGRLRGSASVQPPRLTHGGAEVQFGFGGAAKKYAGFVHERTGSINWSEPGTGAKYLEDPTMEHMLVFEGNLVRTLRVWLEAEARR